LAVPRKPPSPKPAPSLPKQAPTPKQGRAMTEHDERMFRTIQGEHHSPRSGRVMTDAEIYATVFSKRTGWVQFDRRLYNRRHDGIKYGAVLANGKPNIMTLILNKIDTDRGLAALRDGKVDCMRVVPAIGNGTGKYEYCGSVDIEVLNEKVLKNLEPKVGSQGPFWILSLYQLLLKEPW
jgi:hypothetical protein